MSAELVAKALGGMPTRDGGWLCPCPLPSHGKGRGDRNPSLSVGDGEKGLLVNCFGGCSPLDVLAELRSRNLLPDGQASRGHMPTTERRPADHQPDPEALTRWRAAKACPDRALVKRYVSVTRRISLELPPTIRQGSALRCGRVPLPTMIAAVQRPDGQVVAVQETCLTWNATKAPLSCPRITTGALGEGAVRLAPAADVLGIAEGVETALAAMELSGIPCWASLGAMRLGRMWLPEIVRTVYIFADNDEPGRKAATAAAEHHERAGRKALIRRPPSGCNDWNDVLLAEVSA